MSYETCSLNTVNSFEFNIKDITKEFKVISMAKSSDAVAILAQDSCPIIGFWPHFKFSYFTDPKELSKDPLCIDISTDSKYVLTGHKEGYFILWNVGTLTVERVISHEGPSIRNLKFASDNNSFIFSNLNNEIYIMDISSSFLLLNSSRERLIYRGDPQDEAITDVYLPSSTSPYCIFSSTTVVNILSIPQTDKEPLFEPVDIASTPIGSSIFFSTIFSSNGIKLSIYHNDTFHNYNISKGEVNPTYEHSFNVSVLKAFQLNSGIDAAVTSDGQINLVNSFKRTVSVCTIPDFYCLINDCSVPFSLHEKIYLFHPSWMKEVSFIPWQQYIMSMTAAKDWPNVFETAITIYEGTNDRVFDIPKSTSERIAQVQQIMLPVLQFALEECQDFELLQDIIITASKLRFYKFINETALDYCELNTISNKFPTLIDYLNAVFTRKTYSHIKTMIQKDLYQQYLYESHMRGKIQEAESQLYSLEIERNVAAPLLAISLTYKLSYLPIRLWAQYFNNFISPLIYTYETDKFFEYCTEILVERKKISPPRSQLKLCVLWLMTPFNETFPRLHRLLTHDWQKSSPAYIKSIVSLLPISLTDGTDLSFDAAIDAFLRSTLKADYDDVIPALNELFTAIAEKKTQIPRKALTYILKWCFTSSADINIREELFRRAHEQHPDVVKYRYKDPNDNPNDPNFLEYIVGSGFSTIAKEYFEPYKDYKMIIQTMAITPQRRINIPKYLNEHRNEPEIKEAIHEHFSLIVLTDPMAAVDLIANVDPEFHKKIVNSSNTSSSSKAQLNNYDKYLYLKAYYQYENSQFPVDSPKRLTKKDVKELLELTCQFEPTLVLPLLKDKKPTTVPIDEADDLCVNYRVIDASIHIKTMLGALPAAVRLLEEELEYVLVEAIASRKPMRVKNIDLIGDDPVLKKSYHTVLMAFDLLSKAPNLGTILDKMWHDIFLSFQLPLWLANKPHYCDVKSRRSLTLFFAFFIVEALSRKEPEFVLEILRRDFSNLDAMQMKSVLSTVFRYLDYKKMLDGTIKSLLLEDCMTMTHRANLTKKHAAFVYRTNCVICQQPINGESGVGMKLFDCGHGYHDNADCGGNHKVCPLCKGDLAPKDKKKAPEKDSGNKGNIGRRMELRALNRVEFGLRRHYGKDQDLSESGNYVFFLPSYPVDVKKKVKLPESLESSEEITAFLEL